MSQGALEYLRNQNNLVPESNDELLRVIARVHGLNSAADSHAVGTEKMSHHLTDLRAHAEGKVEETEVPLTEQELENLKRMRKWTPQDLRYKKTKKVKK